MRAPRCLNRDRSETIAALLRCRRSSWSLLFSLEPIDVSNKKEYYKSEDEEINDSVDEHSVANCYSPCLLGLCK